MHIDGTPQLTFPNTYTPVLVGTVEAIGKYGGTTYKLLGGVAGYSITPSIHKRSKTVHCSIIINVVSTADLIKMAAGLFRETHSTRVNLDKKDSQTIF